VTELTRMRCISDTFRCKACWCLMCGPERMAGNEMHSGEMQQRPAPLLQMFALGGLRYGRPGTGPRAVADRAEQVVHPGAFLCTLRDEVGGGDVDREIDDECNGS
jgi:hypothetical protein